MLVVVDARPLISGTHAEQMYRYVPVSGYCAVREEEMEWLAVENADLRDENETLRTRLRRLLGFLEEAHGLIFSWEKGEWQEADT